MTRLEAMEDMDEGNGSFDSDSPEYDCDFPRVLEPLLRVVVSNGGSCG